MNGNPDLDRERLTGLFDDLSRELEFARTRVQIYVIGGAAMSMAFDVERTIDREPSTSNYTFRCTTIRRLPCRTTEPVSPFPTHFRPPRRTRARRSIRPPRPR